MKKYHQFQKMNIKIMINKNLKQYNLWKIINKIILKKLIMKMMMMNNKKFKKMVLNLNCLKKIKKKILKLIMIKILI